MHIVVLVCCCFRVDFMQLYTVVTSGYFTPQQAGPKGAFFLCYVGLLCNDVGPKWVYHIEKQRYIFLFPRFLENVLWFYSQFKWIHERNAISDCLSIFFHIKAQIVMTSLIVRPELFTRVMWLYPRIFYVNSFKTKFSVNVHKFWCKTFNK